jgi:tetratricopeptide (TPR) repeat protein
MKAHATPTGFKAHRRQLVLFAVLLLVLVAAALSWHWWRPLPALYVAVVRPEVEEGLPEELADMLRLRLEAELARMRNVHAIGHREVDAAGTDPEVVARAAGAGEVVTSYVERHGRDLRVEIRRERAGGEGLSTGTFITPDSVRTFLGTTGARMRALYSDRRRILARTPGGDYVTLARIWQRVGQPGADYDSILEELQALRAGNAPVEAHVMEVSLCRYLYQATSNPDYLERAREIISARQDEPSVLLAGVEVELAAGEVARARELLAEAENGVGAHPYLWFYRAKIAELEDIGKAIVIVAGARESYLSLNELSRLEIKHGLTDDARDHIERALAMIHSPLLVERLAHLELVSGSLDRAVELYSGLMSEMYSYRHLNNLATARLLTGDYQAAARQYEICSQGGYSSVALLVNLADAYNLSGDSRAEEAYLRVLAATAESHQAIELAYRAQALCFVGSKAEALATVERALGSSGSETEVLYTASIVHRMLGDREQSRSLARQAAEQGLAVHWFNLPWFEGYGMTEYFEALAQVREQSTRGAVIVQELANSSEIPETARAHCQAAYLSTASGDVDTAYGELGSAIRYISRQAGMLLRLLVVSDGVILLLLSALLLGLLWFRRYRAASAAALERKQRDLEEKQSSVILANEQTRRRLFAELEQELQNEEQERERLRSEQEQIMEELSGLRKLRDAIHLEVSGMQDAVEQVSIEVHRMAVMARSEALKVKSLEQQGVEVRRPAVSATAMKKLANDIREIRDAVRDLSRY